MLNQNLVNRNFSW